MNDDDELRTRGITRPQLMRGYAWIVLGFILLGDAAVFIVGIALVAWGAR
mgnify:CR=1 FL=1